MRKQILYYAIKYDGDWKRIQKAISSHEEWKKIDCNYQFITYYDENYPACLMDLECPPWILFYEGNLSLLYKSCIAVVGSREPSIYGMQICHHLVSLLKKKYVIVSGLAKGIDACAHLEALSHATIGVIGCGLDIVYPKENKELYKKMKTQLIISEYPQGVKPFAYHFPWRNRLIAAIGSSLCVVEAKKRSGTLLTVNEALNINREIYCVPYPFFDEGGKGCNMLISQGANILVDDEDIANISHK